MGPIPAIRLLILPTTIRGRKIREKENQLQTMRISQWTGWHTEKFVGPSNCVDNCTDMFVQYESDQLLDFCYNLVACSCSMLIKQSEENWFFPLSVWIPTWLLRYSWNLLFMDFFIPSHWKPFLQNLCTEISSDLAVTVRLVCKWKEILHLGLSSILHFSPDTTQMDRTLELNLFEVETLIL